MFNFHVFFQRQFRHRRFVFRPANFSKISSTPRNSPDSRAFFLPTVENLGTAFVEVKFVTVFRWNNDRLINSLLRVFVWWSRPKHSRWNIRMHTTLDYTFHKYVVNLATRFRSLRRRPGWLCTYLFITIIVPRSFLSLLQYGYIIVPDGDL